MAKKQANGVNKSQAVRDQLAATPNASATEIAAAASKLAGVEIPAALVYKVKAYDASATKKKASPSQPSGSAPGDTRESSGIVQRNISSADSGESVSTNQAPAKAASGSVNLELLKAAAALLQKAGGPQAAKEALEAAMELSKVFGR